MATKEENPPTPKKVAKLATEKASLSPTALIGVFGSDTNPSALILSDGGNIAKVTVGDTFKGSVVSAINSDSLVLARRGKAKVLKLPRA